VMLCSTISCQLMQLATIQDTIRGRSAGIGDAVIPPQNKQTRVSASSLARCSLI
jgi:hypothetical protein